MADIYQDIWNADQGHCGVRAVDKVTPVGQSADHGYVIVDERPEPQPSRRVLSDLVIPEGKRASYLRFEKLLNNYTLDQTKHENDLPEELEEVQGFLEAIHTTPPMETARAYVAQQLDRTVGQDEWWSMIQRVWFERYDMGNNKDLSGFEHTLIGEQKGGEVKGYHFWYKYWLDEHFRLNDQELDLIDVVTFEDNGQDETPDVVTLKYKVRAFDYEAKEHRPLFKPKGGFFVGPSVEGLMAMGTVRFLDGVMAPARAIINGAEYKLTVHPGSTPHNLRSFYPEFVKMVP